jgi:hypothetical protein
VQYVNTHYLTIHFEDIIVDQNLLAFHFLCLNEIIIQNVHLNLEIYNVLSQKFHVLSTYDEHGTMVLYDDIVSLIENTTITNFGVELITTFNDNTEETLYISIMHKPLKMQVSHFQIYIKNIIQKYVPIV